MRLIIPCVVSSHMLRKLLSCMWTTTAHIILVHLDRMMHILTVHTKLPTWIRFHVAFLNLAHYYAWNFMCHPITVLVLGDFPPFLAFDSFPVCSLLW
jgi:hypothetical protein